MAPTMTLARIVRLETLNVLAQDYIRTARSKTAAHVSSTSAMRSRT